MLHAIPSSFRAFFALRFLLGMLESCVAPILILIISMFYKKDEQASRISWFYVMVNFMMLSITISNELFLRRRTGLLRCSAGLSPTCVILSMPSRYSAC